MSHGRQKLYTVVGLRDGGELLVAGVLLGQHECVDLEVASEGMERFATYVRANNADQAEMVARSIARR